MEDQDKIEHIPKSSSEQHKTDAKSDNVVDNTGQSFKLGGNEGASEESLEEAESSYTDKLQEDDRHHTDVEVDEGIRKERVKESKEDLHNTNEDLSKAITLYVPPSPAAYPTGNTESQCYISDNAIAAISQVYVPINCKGSFHWVLEVIVLKERCIHVYDSLKGHRGHAEEIKERTEILSTYLTISNFFEKKERTDWSLLDAYNEKMDQHAFVVHIVNGIVQQSSGTFHNQDPPRPKRAFIPSEDTEMIDVEP
ncbi:hypothetical protein BC332_28148 [Capsicum chinense]|nr:hypothetical protein BC332_28148 [Capsicum chinense]